MEEKRVYCCLATRIPGPTVQHSFLVSIDHRLKKCTRYLVPAHK